MDLTSSSFRRLLAHQLVLVLISSLVFSTFLTQPVNEAFYRALGWQAVMEELWGPIRAQNEGVANMTDATCSAIMTVVENALVKNAGSDSHKITNCLHPGESNAPSTEEADGVISANQGSFPIDMRVYFFLLSYWFITQLWLANAVTYLLHDRRSHESGTGKPGTVWTEVRSLLSGNISVLQHIYSEMLCGDSSLPEIIDKQLSDSAEADGNINGNDGEEGQVVIQVGDARSSMSLESEIASLEFDELLVKAFLLVTFALLLPVLPYFHSCLDILRHIHQNTRSSADFTEIQRWSSPWAAILLSAVIAGWQERKELKCRRQALSQRLKEEQHLRAQGKATDRSEPITNLEDTVKLQLVALPNFVTGLTNLGHTCYLNATLQVLRAIPELQVELNKFSGSTDSDDDEANVTAALRDLYKEMSAGCEAFPPSIVLKTLRHVAPRFLEMTSDRDDREYAPQDAEEAWTRLLMALQKSLNNLPEPDVDDHTNFVSPQIGNFVDQYMTGRLTTKRTCFLSPMEKPCIMQDDFRALSCYITPTTNEMMMGIQNSLDQQFEEWSTSLECMAVHNEQQRIDRLPAYLTVHFIRFRWSKEIGKKIKIVQKVDFPFDLDALPLLSEELKAKVTAARDKMQKVSKARFERGKGWEKSHLRKEEVKAAQTQISDHTIATSSQGDGKVIIDLTNATAVQSAAKMPAHPLEDELVHGEEERKELYEAVDESLRYDVGCSFSGLYELVGLVTHKGAAADEGQYISWVRKDNKDKIDAGGSTPSNDEWYKIEDENITGVTRNEITSLAGGGPDSVAYIALYRSIVVS